ncbi:hypothetical protein IJE86_01925 [bacterium]|nr:hypothetical protein [bacterium]
MINDELFDELFPIGYWYLSYIKEPPKRGKWKYIGIYCLMAYVYERIG